MLLTAPVHCTGLLIFGQSGLDVRTRLLLYQAFKKRELSAEEMKAQFSEVLPLQLGERFSKISLLVTMILGILFIAFSSDTIRMPIPQIHHLFDGPLDYFVLALQ